MIYDSLFADGFQRILDKAGLPVRFRYFTTIIGSVWDDDVTLVKSGNDVWMSGVIQSLDTTQGSIDSNLLEQGKLITSDSKLYVNGSIVLTGSGGMFKVQVGSPGFNYSLIPAGGIDHSIDGTSIFKCAYIRRISSTGSMLGE